MVSIVRCRALWVNELRQQSGNEKQRLRVGELDQEPLKEETSRPGYRRTGRHLAPRSRAKRGYNDAQPQPKKVKCANESEHGKSSRSGCKQCGESKTDRHEEEEVAELDAGDAD